MGSYAGERLSKEFEREAMILRKEYTDRQHFASAFEDMKELRDADEFCDVTIKVENREIKAHRLLLAASSPYFKNLLKDSSSIAVSKTVELADQRYEPVRTIVDYIYSGQIEVSLETVEDLLQAANFLQIDRVQTICSHFLKSALTKESSLIIWNIAGNIGLEDIQCEAKKQSMGSIDLLLNSGTFLNLPQNKVEVLLKESSELSRADKTYRAIVAWVKHDLEKRKKCLGKLLQFVSPQKISREFLRTTVIKEPLLTDDLDCMVWMHQIFISVFDIPNTELSPEEQEIINQSNGHIYICSVRGKFSTFCRFDTVSSEVTDLTTRSKVRYSYPVVYKDSILFTGGLVKTGCSSQCDRFNLKEESWDVLPLECDRYYHAACVEKDQLYIVGGCKDHENLESVRIYDLETGTWSKAPDMIVARKFFGIIRHNGSIYAVGGVTDRADESSTVERYDPREGVWNFISPLKRISGACSAAVAANQIYCTGFRSGIVERFEPKLHQWTNAHDALSLPGCLVSTKGELYRVSIEGVQRYEPYNTFWRNILDVNSFSTEIVAVAD